MELVRRVFEERHGVAVVATEFGVSSASLRFCPCTNVAFGSKAEVANLVFDFTNWRFIAQITRGAIGPGPKVRGGAVKMLASCIARGLQG